MENGYIRAEGLQSRNLYAFRASLNGELSKASENLTVLLSILSMVERGVVGLIGR